MNQVAEEQMEEAADTDQAQNEEAQKVEAETPKVNKNDLKERARSIVRGIEVPEGETLYDARYGTEEVNGEVKAFVVLHHSSDEPIAQLVADAAGDEVTVKLEENWADKDKVKTSRRRSDEARKAKQAEGGGTRGSRSQYNGTLIYPDKASYNEAGEFVNTRMQGSKGGIAMQALIDFWNANPGQGMKYEDYVAKGGASNHFMEDLSKGRIKVGAGEKPVPKESDGSEEAHLNE